MTARGEADEARGRRHLAARRFGRALACFEEALRRGRPPGPTSVDRWTCHMMLGDFEAAWAECDRDRERRRAAGTPAVWDPRQHVLWNGEPLRGRRVMVRCYHGLGDAIQFARYVPRLARICPFVAWEVPPALLALAQGVDGWDHLSSWDDGRPRPDFDVEIECMELPYAFRSTPGTLPAEVPYIRLDAGDGAARAEAPAAAAGAPATVKAGLSWTASPWNPTRSVPARLLAPLAAIAGLERHALQEAPVSADEAALLRLDGGTRGSAAVEETARAMMRMDVVVSADTMTAHLAGALGRPVRLLLPCDGDWRWMAGREDSPWYPTLRIYRQEAPGDWSGPAGRVVEELGRMAESARAGRGKEGS